MLQHKDLLPHPAQRLSAIYLLFDMYKNELGTHPLASVFVHLLVCFETLFLVNVCWCTFHHICLPV